MGIVEKGLRLRNWGKRSHFKEKKRQILNKNEKQRAREKVKSRDGVYGIAGVKANKIEFKEKRERCALA